MPPTGIDDALRLDAVYLSAPIPRNSAILTVLGAVFDKVYFPGVHMPNRVLIKRKSTKRLHE
jgi:hypothetical protein